MQISNPLRILKNSMCLPMDNALVPTCQVDRHTPSGPQAKANVIERLPNDVFAMIFWYMAPSLETYELHRTFLAFSQVSRRWRAVALQDASLWTHVDFRHPDLAATMLERARGAPLFIEVDCDQAGSKLALTKQATVRSLSLRG